MRPRGTRAAATAYFGSIALLKPDGVEPSNWEFAALIGFLIGALFLINSVFFDPYFRGLSMSDGTMEVKGFGRRFRDSLRGDEVRVINESEFASMQNRDWQFQ